MTETLLERTSYKRFAFIRITKISSNLFERGDIIVLGTKRIYKFDYCTDSTFIDKEPLCGIRSGNASINIHSIHQSYYKDCKHLNEQISMCQQINFYLSE